MVSVAAAPTSAVAYRCSWRRRLDLSTLPVVVANATPLSLYGKETRVRILYVEAADHA